MLGLLRATDPAWVQIAANALPDLLRDHAQCELKAAHTALSLLGRFGGEMPALVQPLTALAREEANHFGQVAAQLQQRGESLGHPVGDEYVSALMAAAKHNRHDGLPPLLDRLLVAALVEGRSCERFRLLSEGLPEEGLRNFYRDLMASEARHFTLFTGLASDCFGETQTRTRFETLAAREAEIVARREPGPQVHG